MNIDPGVLATLISGAAAGVLAGLSWILRTLSKQNNAMAGQSQALAVLIARVDPAVQKTQTLDAVTGNLVNRVTALEVRNQIHDAAAAAQNAQNTGQTVTVGA